MTAPTPETTAIDAAAQDVDDILKSGSATDLIAVVPSVVQEARRGYKTTEFWLAVAGTVLTQLGALHLPGKYGDTIATIALVGSYILSRGVAKAGVPASSDLSPATLDK